MSKRHDWPFKKAIVRFPISLKGNSERISGNSLSPLGPGSHDLCDQANNSEGRNKSSRVRTARTQGDSGFGRLSDLFVQSKTKHTLTCSFCSGRIRG